MNKKQLGFGIIEGMVLLIIISMIGLVGWWAWSRHQASPSSLSQVVTQSSSPLNSVTNTSGVYWMINDFDVAKLQEAGMSKVELSYFFNNPHTLLIQNKLSGSKNTTNVEQELPNVTLVSHFASYATLQQAFNAGTISSKTKYIIYDPETWSYTPLDEQTNPISYEQKAEFLVHQHGMKLIFTPANDLTNVLENTSRLYGADKYSTYLSLGIASKGAPYTDMFEIQAQQDEGLTGFTRYVTTAVNQIKNSNPNCIILIGIGSNPNGRSVSAQTILAAYTSVRGLASGFWFNMPETGNNKSQSVAEALSFFNSVYLQAHN